MNALATTEQATMSDRPFLRLSGVRKSYPGVLALAGFDIEVRSGEVIGIVGENGAGKSTLVSILFGHYVADAGSVTAFGAPLPPGNPRAALAAGRRTGATAARCPG